MNNINKLYAESAKIIKEFDLPYEDIANLAKIGQEYTNNFPEVVSLPSGFNGVRETMNDILKQLPIDAILETQKTLQVDLKPLVESIRKLAESISFEQSTMEDSVSQALDILRGTVESPLSSTETTSNQEFEDEQNDFIRYWIMMYQYMLKIQSVLDYPVVQVLRDIVLIISFIITLQGDEA